MGWDPATISCVIALGALIVAVVTLIVNTGFQQNNQDRQDHTDITQQIEEAKAKAASETRIQVSLNAIQGDTREIRSEQKAIRSDMGEVNNRLVKVEESTKSAHHRLDRVDAELNGLHGNDDKEGKR